jgi:serine/threonine-protein kinase
MTKSFGSYELLNLLGQGGMGQVYRAHKLGGQSDVAVKFLRSELISDEQMITRFLQERSLMVSLRHENLVNVLDLVVEDGKAGIVMEYVGGGDVRGLINQHGTVAPGVAARTIRGVLAALAYVHERGVIHRDIKPENVLLDSDMKPKVADFGIARLTDGQRITKVTSIVGTPEYLAPELVEDDKFSPAVDIYATGITLYEMLAGQTPFTGGHPVAVLRRHLETPVPEIEGLKPELRALLNGMLEKDSTKRLTAHDALSQVDVLLVSLGDEPLPAPSKVDPPAALTESPVADVPNKTVVLNPTAIQAANSSKTVVLPRNEAGNEHSATTVMPKEDIKPVKASGLSKRSKLVLVGVGVFILLVTVRSLVASGVNPTVDVSGPTASGVHTSTSTTSTSTTQVTSPTTTSTTLTINGGTPVAPTVVQTLADPSDSSKLIISLQLSDGTKHVFCTYGSSSYDSSVSNRFAEVTIQLGSQADAVNASGYCYAGTMANPSDPTQWP